MSLSLIFPKVPFVTFYRYLKREKTNPSISFLLSATCLWLSSMSSHPISHLTNSKEPLFHFIFQCSHFYLLSFQLSISYWPADRTRRTNMKPVCLCFLAVLVFVNFWDSPQTQPSCLLWLLPPSSAFVSFSIPCFTEDSQKGERCWVPFLILPHFLHFLSFFFLLHLLQSNSCSSFHLYGSISTVFHLSSFLFFTLISP